jgi:tRNA uridine 5-carbamoylmethylation protein Kti12
VSGASGDPILIVSGPPGVGKTTTAAALAARSERSVHLEADTFFRFIRSGYIEPWKPESHEQNRAVMRIVAAAAAGYADAGFLTVVEGIVIPGWFLEPLRDALHAAGHRVAYAVLRVPMEVCVSRAQSREGGPLSDVAAIEQLWRSFQNLGALERNALDLGDLTPEQGAEALAGLWEEGALEV